MSEKLDKLRASLEKERERRIKINTRIESLERRIQEAEAAEVNEMVRTAKVTPEQLAALLRQSATSTPTPAALSAVGATFNKEESDNEDDEYPPFCVLQQELLLSQRSSHCVCDSFFEKFSRFYQLCIFVQKMPTHL